MNVIIAGEKVVESGVVLCNHGETIYIGGSVDVRIEFREPGTEGSSGISPANGSIFCIAAERPQEKQWSLGFGAGLQNDEKLKMVHLLIENIFANQKRVTYTVIEQPKPE